MNRLALTCSTWPEPIEPVNVKVEGRSWNHNQSIFIRFCVKSGHTLKALDRNGPGTDPAFIQSHPAFSNHLSYTRRSLNESLPNVVAVQTESTVGYHNDIPLHSSADTADVDILTDDDDTAALFQTMLYGSS